MISHYSISHYTLVIICHYSPWIKDVHIWTVDIHILADLQYFFFFNKQLHVVSRTGLRLSKDLRSDSGINESVLRVRMRFI